MADEIEYADTAERRRTRIAHRIGVTVFVLILIAALVGFLGNGPLSKARASSPDNRLHLEYLRFIRYQAPVDLKVQIPVQATSNGQLHFQLSKSFVDKVDIQHIKPEPESTAAGPEFFTYTIRTETNRATEVRVRFAAEHLGKLKYEVRLADGPAAHLQHHAFP